jgi:hypothetical protein
VNLLSFANLVGVGVETQDSKRVLVKIYRHLLGTLEPQEILKRRHHQSRSWMFDCFVVGSREEEQAP